MSKLDEAFLNPTVRAENHLNKVLETDELAPDIVVLDQKLQGMHMPESLDEPSPEGETLETEDSLVQIDVAEARFEEPILQTESTREKVRLLICTTDASVLEEGSVAYRRIVDQRDLFLEIHVIVLMYGRTTAEVVTIRLFDTIWIYQTNSRSWWKLSYDAYRIAESQLVFSGGFRADIVVAEDLFEAGIVGLLLSRKYERPFQVHVYEDFFDPQFVDLLEHPLLYTWASRYVLVRSTSVRVKTEFQRLAVIKKYPELEPVTEVLPNYYNLDVWRDQEPQISLSTTYPQFNFIILHVSSMQASSHTHEVMLGAAPILRRYATIGLVIVGNGPLRSFLERQAIALGLQNQIEFIPASEDIISYMKTAHILIHLSDDGSEDDLILQAATVKLPMILNRVGLGAKLFIEGESTCFCEPENTAHIADCINMYLNENQSRSKYALNAYDIVFERIEQDYSSYIQEYSASILRSL